MSSSTETLIQSLISKNPVMVFSKTYCPYCTKAKAKFTDLGVKFAVVELDTRDDGADIQKQLHKNTGQNTVPFVYIDHKLIGGCSDLLELDKNGKLKDMLKQ